MKLLNLNTIILRSIGQIANFQKSENMTDNKILKSRQWLKDPNDHSNGHQWPRSNATWAAFG